MGEKAALCLKCIMPRFFIDKVLEGKGVLDGENGRHAVKSLRIRVGEKLTLCDGTGYDYDCRVTGILGDSLELEVEEKRKNSTEPNISVRLYQGLPKSDKMELIIQKAVELGCCSIAPMETEFCISKLRGNAEKEKKTERWQKISLEAAKQSGRGVVPGVEAPLPFAEAIKGVTGTGILLYEGGGEPLRSILKGGELTDISVFVGPEGGFSPAEVEAARARGVRVATLGPRILRTETAPLAAISAIMYETGNMD